MGDMFFAFMAGVFTTSAMPFWPLVVLVALFALYEVQNKNGDYAAAALLILGLGCQFFGDLKPFTYICDNPWTVAKWTSLSLLFGFGVYAPFFRWLVFVTDRLNELKDRLEEFLKEHGLKGDKIPDELKDEWANDCKLHDVDPKNPIPQISDHKLDYMRWGFLWFIDAPWTILRKPLRRLSRFFYNLFKGIMQSMADWCYSEMIKNFPAFSKVAAATVTAPVSPETPAAPATMA